MDRIEEEKKVVFQQTPNGLRKFSITFSMAKLRKP
jgi:hypothetical protein